MFIRLCIKLVIKNPMMYPPVGPKITCTPDVVPLKTGIPMHPISIQDKVASKDNDLPHKNGSNKSANVCKLNGTG